MTTLRWILGLGTTAMLAGFVVLAMVAGNFRRSFGASPTNPLLTLLPTLAFAVLFAGLLFPGQRLLLHAGALAAAILLSICVVNMSGISLVGISYFGLWLVYYWLAAWMPKS